MDCRMCAMRDRAFLVKSHQGKWMILVLVLRERCGVQDVAFILGITSMMTQMVKTT